MRAANSFETPRPPRSDDSNGDIPKEGGESGEDGHRHPRLGPILSLLSLSLPTIEPGIRETRFTRFGYGWA
jgi:hypothetical protein